MKFVWMGHEWSSVVKGDCVGNTNFKHRNLHKYTRMAQGRDRVEVMG